MRDRGSSTEPPETISYIVAHRYPTATVENVLAERRVNISLAPGDLLAIEDVTTFPSERREDRS